MQIVKHPKKSEWAKLLQRPVMDSSSLEASVKNILHEVKASGDEALKRFATIFDKVNIDELQVTPAEIEKAAASVSNELKQAIAVATTNPCRKD
jgi:histidinol dehydrogenase